ncbi:MAG: hypothetical protein FWE37_05730 [Spirochaetaceae bacterium]|nr:hypothetical protein [Spirochaetaceae bacterium]
MSNTTPNEALTALKDGNARFLAGNYKSYNSSLTPLTAGQSPYAAILSCADSCVPPEILFNAGFGDIFVVRVAGNIAASSQVGSLEFAVTNLNVPLIVVMGHTQCGIIEAAINNQKFEGDLGKVVNSLKKAGKLAAGKDINTVTKQVTLLSKEELLKSPVIHKAVTSGKIKVVTAICNIASGTVEFFNEEEAVPTLSPEILEQRLAAIEAETAELRKE